MTLRLSPDHLHTIRAHAQHTYPEECCGLLLGTRDQDANETIELWQATNAWNPEAAELLGGNPSDRHRRFWIDPQELLMVHKYARDRHLDVIGVYHSHPDHPAVPSECDRAIAWEGYSYIIVSVEQGSAKDLLCWRLNFELQFQPEPLTLTNPHTSSSSHSNTLC